MIRRLTLVDPANPAASAVEVEVDGDPTTPLTEVRARLDRFAAGGSTLFVGSAMFPTDGTLSSAPLVDGDRIGIGGPIAPNRIDRRWTTWELRFVGGPPAGRVVPLPPGRHELGRSGSLLTVPEDALLSRQHALLEVGDELTLTDLGSRNGTFVEGERLESPLTLEAGQVVQVGASLFTVVPATTPDLRLTPQADGRLGLNRRFRTGEEPLPEEVPFPSPPTPGDPPGLNLVTTLAPAALILVVILLMSSRGGANVGMFAFMAMSPLIGVGGAIGRRRSYERKLVTEHERYREGVEAARSRLIAARGEEVRIARAQHPDPAAVVQCARAQGRLLWARRGGDPDLLELRIGSGSRRSGVRAQNADVDDASLWMAPIPVSLPHMGGVGIVGPAAPARGVARSLVLQAAVLHSPAEVRIVVLADDGGEADWGWTRWLPHARWAHDEAFALVGSDGLSTRLRLEELQELVRRRRDAQLGHHGDGVLLPAVLVVYDGVARLLDQGFAEILRDGPQVGIFAITLDEAQVPEGVNASITLGPDGDDAVVEQVSRPSVTRVVADHVSAEAAEIPARCLAPIRLVGEDGVVELPPQLRLLELLELGSPDAAAVGASWSRHTRDPRAVVGLTTSGPLVLDLTRDGPHGIIAGTTRSGKSEFLKTLIASLAATNHPDDLSFLFIDFKGGNDYQLAATLPHTVDLATQIDQSGFERSLQLLDAEIIRRQEITRTLQTSTIEGYWAAQASAPPGSSPTLGRLVVIVDEFAELAQKNPLQLEKLVSVARVGAAYGVHLLLATQKPTGVVSGQIDANAALRLCFRTRSKDDSNEVIGTPAAGEIAERHRGRGYKKAHAEAPLEFQCARVGNARPGSAAVAPLRVSPSSWSTLGHIPPEERAAGEVPDPDTDFYDLVEAIREAARSSGWTSNAVPWPKPLPANVTLDDLPSVTTEPVDGVVPFAVADDPTQQAHVAAPLVLGTGHVAIAGSGGTGRTAALRTVAASAARTHGVDRLHVYALDFAGGGLAGLTPLPHCGGVAADDPEVTGRVLDHLDAEIRARRARFESSGVSDLREHNRLAGDVPLPWLLLLIDGWEVLHEESQSSVGSALHDRILRLLADGLRFGLQAVVAGDRWAASGRAGRVMSHRFVLRFNSDMDYDSCGIRSSQVPDAMPAGRAIGAEGREHQIAVLGDGSGPGQMEALRAICDELRVRDAAVASDRRPARIQSLPGKADLDSLMAQSAAPPDARVPVLVGFAASTGGPLWIDLAEDAPGFLVVGRRRSGRTTALLALGRSALDAGVEVVVLSPRSSALTTLEGHAGVRGVHSGERAATADVTMLEAGDRVLVLVDDADTLDPMHPGITALLSTPHPNRAVAVAATTEFAKNQLTGYLATLRRSRSGVILSPESPYDGGALGVANLPRPLLFDGPEGRGVLAVAGELTVVQTPWTT